MNYMECSGWTCLKYSLFTFLGVLVGTLVLHVLSYVLWSLYVTRYHSADLVAWREGQLAKIPDK